MKYRKFLILLITFFFFTKESNANYKNSCNDHKLGWNFYCNKEIKQQKQESEKTKELQSLSLGEIAKAKTKAIKEKHQELLDIATHFPTTKNIKNYIKFNQQILDKSSYFAEVSQRAIWQNPDINYSLKRPVNSVGKKTWIKQRNEAERQAVLSLNEKYGIFFFYRSDCPYCHAYSPVLKSFAKQYNLKVMAISMDGGILPEWPNSKIDQGQSNLFHVSKVPATMLFEKQTSQIIPVGFGALSHQELSEQIYILTEVKIGETL